MAPRKSTISYINADDGLKLAVTKEGAKGPFILWCYGLVCSKTHFKYQMSHFKHFTQNIIVDYRGHGKTTVTKKDEISVLRLVKDLENVVESLGATEVHVVGHSMGGNIAAWFAERNKALTKHLVLINTPVDRPFETMFNTNVLEFVVKNLRKFNRQYPEIFSKIWKSDNYFVDKLVHLLGFNVEHTKFADVREYMDGVRKIDPEVFFKLLSDLEVFDRRIYASIECPTLIVQGEKDFVTPLEHGKLLNQLIPNSKLNIFSEGSHVVPMDFPEFLNDLIVEFLHLDNS